VGVRAADQHHDAVVGRARGGALRRRARQRQHTERQRRACVVLLVVREAHRPLRVAQVDAPLREQRVVISGSHGQSSAGRRG
jgi:hypothetical protein